MCKVANDTVATAELAFTDNDNLASLLLNVVNADLYINLTSAKGVYTSNPDGDPTAKPIEVIEDIQSLDLEAMCGGKTTVGTGGMLSKLTAAGRAAQLGVPTLIISGLQKDAIVRAFSGEKMGTWVCPDTKKVSSRKFWLAYHSDPEGSVIVDAGAEKALVERGKSLLPAGITRVDGVFSHTLLLKSKASKPSKFLKGV